MQETFEYHIRISLPEGATQLLKDRLTKFASICEYAMSIFAIKNHTYGDAIRWGGVRGAVYELIGSISRLHFMVNKRAIPMDVELWEEGIGDTLLDTLNYAVICRILLDDANIDGQF